MTAKPARPIVELAIYNESSRKRLYRKDELLRLVEQVCCGEGIAGEIEVSVLLCDDSCIARLNRDYRNLDRPTDVLSFCQDSAVEAGPRVLGDIVISLETVERHCHGDRKAMRDEVRLLFCHGLLHLLNYTHGSASARADMAGKQARYLGVPLNAAWPDKPPVESAGQS